MELDLTLLGVTLKGYCLIKGFSIWYSNVQVTNCGWFNAYTTFMYAGCFCSIKSNFG